MKEYKLKVYSFTDVVEISIRCAANVVWYKEPCNIKGFENTNNYWSIVTDLNDIKTDYSTQVYDLGDRKLVGLVKVFPDNDLPLTDTLDLNVSDYTFVAVDSDYEVVSVIHPLRILQVNKWMVSITNAKSGLISVSSDLWDILDRGTKYLWKLKGDAAKRVWNEAVNKVLANSDYDTNYVNSFSIAWDIRDMFPDFDPKDFDKALDQVAAYKEQFLKSPAILTSRHYRDITINYKTNQCLKDGHDIRLDRNEMKLFTYMVEHPNQLLTRKELVDNLFEPPKCSKFIDAMVSRIRKKLGSNKYITTKPGLGYIIEQ